MSIGLQQAKHLHLENTGIHLARTDIMPILNYNPNFYNALFALLPRYCGDASLKF